MSPQESNGQSYPILIRLLIGKTKLWDKAMDGTSAPKSINDICLPRNISFSASA
jgi:hypothetical protein